MHSIALYVQGHDDHARMTRRTLMRYLNLTLILVLRSISSAVKRRFPKLDHLVEAGTTSSLLHPALHVPFTHGKNIVHRSGIVNYFHNPVVLHPKLL